MKAKTYFMSLILLVISYFGQSQPKQGDNIKNAGLNKYEGTYIWSQGTDTLKILLKKENVELI